MNIITHVELSQAQEKTLKAFKRVVVRATLTHPVVIATFDTFQAQQVKLTIDSNGVIKEVNLVES